jgi:uncharacterized protein
MARFSYTAGMTEHKHPPKLDVKQAAQTQQRLAGQDRLSHYERLMHEAQGQAADQALSWSAAVELRPDPAGHDAAWLHLTVQTVLPQVCQRCLGPVDIAVQVDREFRFVDTEALAEQQDDASEEDVLVSSRDFDLAALIEDEVLMALPLVPLHEICPVVLKMAAQDQDFDGSTMEKPNPFAVLAQLKAKDAS